MPSKPIRCPRRHDIECDTPNACAGGADCRFGPDPATQSVPMTILKSRMSSQPKQNRHRLADRPGKGRGAEPASTPGAEIDPSAGWTIDPPPNHAHHSFHWAYREKDSKWLVFEARDGVLWHSLGQSLNSATLYHHGWRYVGPAIPPKKG